MNGSRFGRTVLPVGIILLATLGVATAGAWPPFVAVESDSMAPGVERGDLVIVTGTERSPWGDGVTGSSDPDPPDRLGDVGDVVVFTSPDAPGRPILHRIAFEVTAGDDWTEHADPDRLNGDCSELSSCPAPHDGYVTYGDANAEYDQSSGIAPIVREEWVHAKAIGSIPYLGYARIGLDATIRRFGVVPATVGLVVLAAVLGGFGSTIAGRIRDDRRSDRTDEDAETRPP